MSSLVAATVTAYGCKVGKFRECRQSLIEAIFNESTLPARAPDFILPNGGPQVDRGGNAIYTMNGFPSPGNGSFVGDVSWENNLTALVWTMTTPHLTLNTTVLYSLNTSSRATANYGPGPFPKGGSPLFPKPTDPWGARIFDLVLMLDPALLPSQLGAVCL